MPHTPGPIDVRKLAANRPAKCCVLTLDRQPRRCVNRSHRQPGRGSHKSNGREKRAGPLWATSWSTPASRIETRFAALRQGELFIFARKSRRWVPPAPCRCVLLAPRQCWPCIALARRQRHPEQGSTATSQRRSRGFKQGRRPKLPATETGGQNRFRRRPTGF